MVVHLKKEARSVKTKNQIPGSKKDKVGESMTYSMPVSQMPLFTEKTRRSKPDSRM